MLQLVQLNEVFVLRQADMLQADANMRAFEEHTHALTQRAEQVEQRYAELKAAHTAVVAAAREAMTEATAMLANLSEEDSNMILGLDVNETEETINLRIGENKTLLSHISVQAGDTVEKFEERQKQIDEQKVANKRRKEKLDGARDAIQRVAEPFKLELEGMVRAISEQFAASFQAISGKGLVALVSPEDDYSKWALDIHVQFYETSGFNRLDGLRQSGGERAVSTVFFLMALQSLTTAPFRVVDEINQGMDPRNERLVHGRMVAASCEGDTVSQYFLITPKLLPGLKYHPYMKVHCVTSGNLGQRDNKMRGKRYLEALKQRAQQMQEV
jgi:chromosome segregation ATPase